MPILAENRARYPKDWALRSRFVRFVRARGRCEWCGARQYAVGRWIDGAFHYLIDEHATYREARSLADDMNHRYAGTLVVPYIVIVLTVAHVYDDRPEASSLLNLAALCKRCHNGHDAAARRAGTRERRRAFLAVADLFA